MTPLAALILGLVVGYCVGPVYMFLYQMTKSMEGESCTKVNTLDPLYLTTCEVCKGRRTIKQADGRRVECVACGGGGYEVTDPRWWRL